ncbi:MAG: hypothetical protein GKR89_17680 [Candidatus Latescibacteria bacterium]|nr:hypothetical protein [Candidatus Latescibacterota bacterium]
MRPVLTRISGTRYDFKDFLGDYLQGVTDQWLRVAPKANPAILEMFRDRDRKPRRDLLPWSGEFAGKFLTSAVQVLRLTGDPELKAYIKGFVARLVELQDKDGYLGPFPKRNRLSGEAPNVGGKQGPTWDAWGHYHAMLGLLLWHQESRDGVALDCAAGIADLFCRKFLGKKRRRLVDTGSSEMNIAVIHSLCLLYRKRRENRYLQLAEQIVDEFAAQGPDGPLAGDYLRTGLAAEPFFATPKPRWESLHPIMGLAELYWLTGRADYRTAFENIWWSIVKLDRHNNGGFSSGEKAQGNPYHPGAIETCCTVAWMAASVEMLRLTGNSVVADELELSTLNSGVGLHSYSGRWVTYDTPMDGVRKASAHSIVFQAREGSPELNCCSVNGPRALGLLDDWALMRGTDGLVLNWYGAGRMQARVGGQQIELVQRTDYPRQGGVQIAVRPDRAVELTLQLRIPYWSARTRVKVNGEAVKGVKAGTYLRLERRWKKGDTIDLELDMRPHFWRGEKECRGQTSIFRGPVLLTYDRRFNEMDPDEVPPLALKGMRLRPFDRADEPPTIVVVEGVGSDGRKVRLCDFASAGEGGSPYRTWLQVEGTEKTAFSRQNPLRSGRP